MEIDPRPVDAYAAMRGRALMVVIVYWARYRVGEVRRSDEHDAHRGLSPADFQACTTLVRLADAVDPAVGPPVNPAVSG